MCRLVPDSGRSKQYFTRTAVVSRGTSNGTITKLLLNRVSNSPLTTWSGSIAAPEQGVVSGAACAGAAAGRSRASATSAGRSARSTRRVYCRAGSGCARKVNCPLSTSLAVLTVR